MGFRPVAAPKGRRHFDGDLHCKLGEVPVQIQISDWDFSSYPVINVRERPEFLQGLLPHLFGSNGLCYFATGSVILDRYYPDVALAQCLQQARDVLDRLAIDPDYRQTEFEAEFGATWSLGQLPLPETVLLADVADADVSAPCHFLNGRSFAYVTHRAEELVRFCQARGWPQQATTTTCWLLRTSSKPLLREAMPRTVAEMFVWLRLWAMEVYVRIQEVLADRAYLASSQAMFLVRTPVGWFGFGIQLDATKRKAYQRKARLYRHYLHTHGGGIPITRYSVTDIGSEFVHSRNLSYPSLKDRQITLVGCGAIGGYTAHALAKLGAGSGTKGRLRLIDPDLLGPGNLGRHYLGTDYLFAFKAQAVATDLLKQFPTLNVVAEVRAVNFSLDLDGDLVINATGEESLSEAINYHHLRRREEARTPLLHVWILGNGQCAQAIWVDRRKFACYRCLCHPGPERRPRFDVLDAPRLTKVLGCTAFTPYAVSAPMAAAALATDTVIGWLEGNPAPRFRTRAVEGPLVRKLKNQDLSPLQDCPACSTTSFE